MKVRINKKNILKSIGFYRLFKILKYDIKK